MFFFISLGLDTRILCDSNFIVLNYNLLNILLKTHSILFIFIVHYYIRHIKVWAITHLCVMSTNFLYQGIILYLFKIIVYKVTRKILFDLALNTIL
jgi:hypothetical protein